MTPTEHLVAARTWGRVLREGAGKGARGTLVGFHGYGENALINLELLAGLDPGDAWCRCAIEAMNVFYRRRTGEVVACWMTRLHRERAIEDNLRYVEDALALIGERGAPRPRVYVGFSQGAAMAYRAAARGRQGLEGLLVGGGDVPPELTPELLSGLPPTMILRGTEDPWYRAETFQRDCRRLVDAGVQVSWFEYSGGHEWGRAALRRAAAFLETLR